MARDGETEREQPARPAVVGWIVYDVGNTLFFAGILGLFFPLWITRDLSGDDATLGYTLAVAMGFTLFLAPVVGALSDQLGRRMPFLVVGTLVCIGATVSMGGDSLALALGLFAVAVVSLNTANVFYNAMLADVSTEDTRGTIGGIGVGIGYLGATIAVAIGLIFVESRGYVFGFRAVGIAMLLASVPLMILLKEHAREAVGLSMSQIGKGTLLQLRITLSGIDRFPGLLRFLIARFWYTWGVNTASTFSVLYATGTVGLSTREVQLIILVGIMAAIPSGFVWGIIVDRTGPNRVLSTALFGWVIVLLLAAAIPWLGLSVHLWWGIGVVSGVLVAGIWAADRPYMIRLASPRYLGEFFGIHSLMGRLSAITGPFTWSYIAVTLDLGQIAAVLSVAGCAAIAFAMIWGLRDEGRTVPDDFVIQ